VIEGALSALLKASTIRRASFVSRSGSGSGSNSSPDAAGHDRVWEKSYA
jgi:hypothetical protein